MPKLKDVKIERLSGLSNACYRVALSEAVNLSDENVRVLFYRKFLSSAGDRNIEAVIFESMAEKGLGPQIIYSEHEFRLEEFISGRPLSIWEMRNPVIMESIARAIYDFHHESGAAEKVQSLKPVDSNNLSIDFFINDWGPKAVIRLASIRSKLQVASNPGHLKISEILDLLE